MGVLVAKTLGMAFVDTDLLLQQSEKRLLQEIIEQEGSQNFCYWKKNSFNFASKIFCYCYRGQCYLQPKGMQHLQKNGLIVYLQLPYGELVQRIHNMAARGIVMTKNQTLAELYAERKDFYEKYAEIIINCSGLSIEESVQKVCAAWQNYQQNKQV